MRCKIDLAQKGEERSGVRKEDEKGTSGIAQIEKGKPHAVLRSYQVSGYLEPGIFFTPSNAVSSIKLPYLSIMEKQVFLFLYEPRNHSDKKYFYVR